MSQTILSLIAREPDYGVKHRWNKIYQAFYGRNSLRTFTMGARVPLNLSSLFAVSFHLSLLMDVRSELELTL